MKTQNEIVERIRTTKDVDTFGNGLLFLFLEEAGQIEIMGKRLVRGLSSVTDKRAYHTPLTEADIGPMLLNLIAQVRSWPSDDRFQTMRKDRIRALIWLVDDDKRFVWNRPARDLIHDIELVYGLENV